MATPAQPTPGADRRASHAQARLHPAGRARRQVMLLSDGSGSGQDAPHLAAALATDATTIRELAKIPITAHAEPHLDAPPGDAAHLTDWIAHLPDTVDTVLVTRTDPARARAAQRRNTLAGGRPVLIDEDLTAIALTAATLTYLSRIGRDPHRARILIAGAASLPTLALVLIGTGFPDITMWDTADAARFPLDRVSRDADVVLDLLPGNPATAALVMDRPERSVISHTEIDATSLVAPGLLRAVLDHPPGTFQLDISDYHTCAAALAAAIPPRKLVRTTRADQSIALAIATALHTAARNRDTPSSPPPSR